MSFINSNDSAKVQLLDTISINTTLGLEYFNNNHTLYLKILKSFRERYKNLNLNDLDTEELRNTIHTLKGLAGTLGMEPLSKIIKQIEKNIDKSLHRIFEHELTIVVGEIKKIS